MKYLKRIKSFISIKIVNILGYFRYFKIKIYCPLNCHLFERVSREGIYESKNLKTILSNIKDNTYYIDVGANIGLMSIPVLVKNNNCKVISIEPSPSSFQYLQKTFLNSPFKERWQIINKAVSNVNTTANFTMFSEDYSAFEGLKNTKRIICEQKEILVDVLTLDEIWSNLKNPPISFIKIDVEGNEFFVLKGALKMISYCKPMIQVECNTINMSAYGLCPKDIVALVEDINYEIKKMPEMTKINSVEDLSNNMKHGEDYCLCPRNQTN